jgi:hypothetical protein
MQIGHGPTNTLDILEYVFIPIVLLQFAWRKIQFATDRVPMIQTSPYEIKRDDAGGVGLLIPMVVNADLSFGLGEFRSDVWTGVVRNRTMQGSLVVETIGGDGRVEIRPGRNEIYVGLNVSEALKEEFLETRDGVFPKVGFQGPSIGGADWFNAGMGKFVYTMKNFVKRFHVVESE